MNECPANEWAEDLKTLCQYARECNDVLAAINAEGVLWAKLLVLAHRQSFLPSIPANQCPLFKPWVPVFSPVPTMKQKFQVCRNGCFACNLQQSVQDQTFEMIRVSHTMAKQHIIQTWTLAPWAQGMSLKMRQTTTDQKEEYLYNFSETCSIDSLLEIGVKLFDKQLVLDAKFTKHKTMETMWTDFIAGQSYMSEYVLQKRVDDFNQAHLFLGDDGYEPVIIRRKEQLLAILKYLGSLSKQPAS